VSILDGRIGAGIFKAALPTIVEAHVIERKSVSAEQTRYRS
jgi:hypothetical protein